ncbi:MAG: chemotaxis protein CheA [Clostridiales bacterium]|nr:chemotaxis protein CheA [Clostridiales bacterium]
MDDILRDAFYEEADEMFQEIEDALLEIDGQGATRERIDNLFRYMHTLKGSSSAMEIHDMAKLTHHLEDILGQAREGELTLGRDIINLMFSCLDQLKIRVAKHKKDEIYEIDIDKYISTLNNLLNASVHVQDMSQTEDEGKLYEIKIKLDENSIFKGARLFIITDRLGKEGQVVKTSWDGINIEAIEGQEFDITYRSERTGQEIEKLIYQIPDVDKVHVSEISQQTRKQKEQTRDNKGQTSEEVQSVIRVSINKLDKLLRIVEELSVDKERLKQLMKRVEEKYGHDSDVKSLSNLVNQIDFIGNEMQESVMSARMYTLDSVFRRFPRMVRDLALKQGKEIELKVEGENTELDRSIIEKIVDPLTHVIRNAVDHGIETPEQRQRFGKTPKGTIKLSAGQDQGHIYIKVEDDGRGIDIDSLKASAINKGLLSEEEIESLSEKELLEVIFMPGFSTSEEVTDVSGRGVGMNVVKDNIEKINGVIEMENRLGQGLTITFKLPLTLAIIQSLLIRSHKYRFAIPLLSVIEIIRIKEAEYAKRVRFANGHEVMNWRGEVLPVIRVRDLFNDVNAKKQKTFIGIVIGFSTSKIILGVEEIIGQQQVVIKSLEKFTGKDNVLGELRGISGTAILGDGNFAYVLDIQTLIREMIKEKRIKREA